MKKYIFKSIGLLVAIATLSSCLKDDRLVLDPDKGTNVIEFQNPSDIAVHGSTYALYSIAFPIVTTPTEVPVTVSYSGPADGAPEDITVSVGLGDAATITQYNTENAKTFTLMDPAVYTINATSVVIPKGKKTATFTVSVKTSLFDLTKSYALPLKIKSVSSGTISSNFSNILLNLAAKNKFDGSYTYTSTIFANDRPTILQNTEFLYPVAYDIQLRTSGANSNGLWNGAFGDYLIPILSNTGGVSGFGSTNLQITFDPATNKVLSVVNGIAAPANGRAMSLDPAAPATTNYFDPVSHNVYLQFFMTQPGFAPTKIVAVLKYKGPRP
ncbi:DUF1735 domain-containing protein [Pedobacter frigiditerrae]|uniref:DUF1735 domain-containing protein n=1 Tax=Pedobacter frigiditerrae TaxID=2530452 RepID=A0A4V2MJF2_9SPHI|nr:DUF1735 domain-containing protein [Pedobacter frigiditerrae]TCC94026.1 DUF1735 domain-containing protein [Pedobacter frigiditerrae]